MTETCSSFTYNPLWLYRNLADLVLRSGEGYVSYNPITSSQSWVSPFPGLWSSQCFSVPFTSLGDTVQLWGGLELGFSPSPGSLGTGEGHEEQKSLVFFGNGYFPPPPAGSPKRPSILHPEKLVGSWREDSQKCEDLPQKGSWRCLTLKLSTLSLERFLDYSFKLFYQCWLQTSPGRLWYLPLFLVF